MIYVEGVVGDQAGTLLPPEDPRGRERTVGAARVGMTRSPTIPLVRRFPALARVPRIEIGRFPTPVQPLARTFVRRSGSSATICAETRWAATRCARWSFCSAT